MINDGSGLLIHSEHCQQQEHKVEQCYGVCDQILFVLHVKTIFKVASGSDG
jgi:hypothetical protein